MLRQEEEGKEGGGGEGGAGGGGGGRRRRGRKLGTGEEGEKEDEEDKEEEEALGRRWFKELPLPTCFVPFGEGVAPPLPPRGGEVSEGIFSPKTAPKGPRRAQDGLQDGSI